MAKYYFTSGKRKGKVYQEFYYTLNGQQIVNKKVNYCPVNTKWLSKEEFKQYILQLIESEYPNYLVVDELPEEPQNHIIYFLKQVNEDESIYYDVYVYDNEELKQITFQGGGSDVHLYAHHYHYDLSGKGEVNFMIYSSSSTELNNTQLGDYLYELGCDRYYRAYPANGQSRRAERFVSGIYVNLNSSGSLKYTIRVISYTTNGYLEEYLSDYSSVYFCKIVQIF